MSNADVLRQLGNALLLAADSQEDVRELLPASQLHRDLDVRRHRAIARAEDLIRQRTERKRR